MKISQFWALQSLTAEAETRTIRLIKTVLLTVEVALAIYVLGLWASGQHFERFYLLLGTLPLLAYLHFLLRQRQVHLAGLISVWGLWAVITVSAFTSGGVHSPTFFTYTIPILLAGLLIERRAGIAFACASALLGLVMVWTAGEAAILSAASPFNNPVLGWLVGSLTFGIVAILQYVEVSDLGEALLQAQIKEYALSQTNQALQARTQELEQREQALQRSEASWRTLVQVLPDLIARIHVDGTVLDVKVPPEFVASRPVQQLIGYRVQDCLPPDFAQQLFTMYQQALASDEIQIYEYSVVVAGEQRWRELRILALGESEVLAIIRDITRRKHSLEALHQSEERYRQLVELSPDAILLYRNQQVLFANPAGLRLWGASAVPELVGKPVTELIQATDPQTEQIWARSLLGCGETALNLAQKIIRLDGRLVDVEVSAVAYQDSAGVAVQVICRDITERRQTEERNQQLLRKVEDQHSQLRALNLRLAKVEENERKRLARELHDRVAQNLTGLNLNLNVLQRHLQNELAPESRVHVRLSDAITLVEQATVQLRNVMADLRPPVLDDYGLLVTLEWYATQLMQQSDLQIEVLGETLIPRPAEYVELTLFRIVQEALTNVLQHAQATQVMVVLTFDDKSIYVSISDDGLGIAPTDEKQPDKQQHWGLITMRERAEAIGGHCQIESYPFLGTTVMIEVLR